MPPNDADRGFFSRWSQRKAQVRQGERPADAPAPSQPPTPQPALQPGPQANPAVLSAPATPRACADPPAPAAPPPTLDDLHRLDATDPSADFSRFMQPDVAPGLKNAALKKLFTDPHFNVMDGLDTYIDDYGRPDPLSPEMLARMVGSEFLGLVQPSASPAPPTGPETCRPLAADGHPPTVAPPCAAPTAGDTATPGAAPTPQPPEPPCRP